MRNIVLIVHNVRSAHNVGSLLRTADGLGVAAVYLSGYTPYPRMAGDSRLPHIALRLTNMIQKTSLGAEKSLILHKIEDIETCLVDLRRQKYAVAALEQTKTAIRLDKFRPPAKVALIVGNEITGIENSLLNSAAVHLEIPMLGIKESLNVSVAAAITLYHLRYS